eukprot:3269179-Heterocapsa_arctica.AAC.1
MQLTQHLVKGVSLLDRMCADRRSSRDDNTRIGLAYFAGLKTDYNLTDSSSSLVLVDTTQAIDPTLLAALALAKHPNAATRSKSLLSS